MTLGKYIVIIFYCLQTVGSCITITCIIFTLFQTNSYYHTQTHFFSLSKLIIQVVLTVYNQFYFYHRRNQLPMLMYW